MLPFRCCFLFLILLLLFGQMAFVWALNGNEKWFFVWFIMKVNCCFRRCHYVRTASESWQKYLLFVFITAFQPPLLPCPASICIPPSPWCYFFLFVFPFGSNKRTKLTFIAASTFLASQCGTGLLRRCCFLFNVCGCFECSCLRTPVLLRRHIPTTRTWLIDTMSWQIPGDLSQFMLSIFHTRTSCLNRSFCIILAMFSWCHKMMNTILQQWRPNETSDRYGNKFVAF